MMTEQQLREYLARTGQPIPPELEEKPKRAKYGSRKTEARGRVFDSQREANRFAELDLMLRAGEIVCLAMQVPFQLSPSVRYVADFVYRTRAGAWVVEDAKGVRTKEYSLKRRLMKDQFGIEIVEV